MNMKQTKVQRTETKMILRCAASSYHFSIFYLQIFGCAAPAFPEVIPFDVWFKNRWELSRIFNDTTTTTFLTNLFNENGKDKVILPVKTSIIHKT